MSRVNHPWVHLGCGILLALLLGGSSALVAQDNGKEAGAGETPTWAFPGKKDDFKNSAVLDLRYLNEKVAGESGFVKLSTDGNSFVLGSGKPVRFFAVNSGVETHKDAATELPEHAKFLAKHGVNMARWFGDLVPHEGEYGGKKLGDPNTFNQKAVDAAHLFVAAMKKEGIYTLVTPYWAGQNKIPTAWGIDGPDGQNAQGILFFNPKLQEYFKGWLKGLLTTPNPHTGLPLGKDPSVAIIQIQNEDGMFFWTMDGVKGPQRELLGKQFGEWLAKKYGSLDKAVAAWGGEKNKDDKIDQGIVGLYITWDMTQPQKGNKQKRVTDQMEFMIHTQRKFNSDMAKYLREDLGCKQLINASNWKPGEMVHEGDQERYTYAVNDVIAVNRYFGGNHKGPNNGWCIMPGDTFTQVSITQDPSGLPTNLKRVAGHPMLITESTWVPPYEYQSEGPFLASVYQSLCGINVFYWFAFGDAQWMRSLAATPFVPHLSKWGQGPSPMVIGQFPANALLFRKGYVKEGTPVVYEERSLASLYERKTPLIAEDKNFDPNRVSENMPTGSTLKTGADPKAFLVGPVVVKYDGNEGKSKIVPLDKYILNDGKEIKSITGEVNLNLEKNFCTVNAPKAQGVTGFLSKTGTFELADVEIVSENPYATVVVVPLDDQPLKTSHKVLVQVGTMQHSTGWQVTPTKVDKEEGFKIDNPGKAPWRIDNTRVTVKVKNAGLKKAVLLDINGYTDKDVPAEVKGGALTVKLPENALYVVLE